MVNKYKPSEVMKQMEFLGWVKSFDPAIKGQYYFLPKGTLVFNHLADLLKNWVKKELHALEIRTPVLYDWFDNRIQAESALFEDRVFKSVLDTKKTAVLRPGGDYGVLSLFSKQHIAENHLPISLFELASSFRKCQSRELGGLLKARSFTLLDYHALTANSEQAWEMYIGIILAQAKLGDFFNFSWQLHLQIEKNFLMRYEKKIKKLEDVIQKPLELNILEKKSNYWTMQHHFMDRHDDISFSDGQYDETNAENYDIQYSRGKEKIRPIICHGAFDSVERWLFKLVSRGMSSQGNNFPIWLLPIHLRLIPYSHKTQMAAEIIKSRAILYGIQSDIDFREKSIAARVNQSHQDWVPFTLTFPNDFESIDTSPLYLCTMDNIKKSDYMHGLLAHIQSKLNAFSHPVSDLDSLIKKPCLR